MKNPQNYKRYMSESLDVSLDMKQWIGLSKVHDDFRMVFPKPLDDGTLRIHYANGSNGVICNDSGVEYDMSSLSDDDRRMVITFITGQWRMSPYKDGITPVIAVETALRAFHVTGSIITAYYAFISFALFFSSDYSLGKTPDDILTLYRRTVVEHADDPDIDSLFHDMRRLSECDDDNIRNGDYFSYRRIREITYKDDDYNPSGRDNTSYDVGIILFYMASYADDPFHGFIDLGIERCIRLMNMITMFPLSKYSMTQRMVVNTAIDVCRESSDAFEWYMGFMYTLIAKGLIIDGRIDKDFVLQHESESMEFITEAPIVVSDNAIDGDEYMDRRLRLMTVIANRHENDWRIRVLPFNDDGIIVNNHTCSPRCLLFNGDHAQDMLYHSINWCFSDDGVSNKSIMRMYGIMGALTALPERLWGMMFDRRNNGYSGSYMYGFNLIRRPSSLYTQFFPHGKTLDVMTALMGLDSVDAWYRWALWTNVQNHLIERAASGNILDDSGVKLKLNGRAMPSELYAWIRDGVVPTSITYDNGSITIPDPVIYAWAKMPVTYDDAIHAEDDAHDGIERILLRLISSARDA